MIPLSLFWYNHDIMMLSWYIKISSLSTTKLILKNSWYHDIIIDILILSWYYDVIMISQNIKPLHTYTHPGKHLILWYCYQYSDIIMILSWYLTIIRRRQSEYWWIFPETKSRGIFTNIHEPEVNNCFRIITQVIIEIPKLRNIKFYHNCC